MTLDLWIYPLILLVAAAYSLVGHGGASGYLAILAFTAVPTSVASTTALGLNVVVSLVTFLSFRRAKHFRWNLAWPFLVGSIPMAFIGGALRLESSIQNLLLGLTLAYASLVLMFGKVGAKSADETPTRHPSPILAVVAGASIGLLSGIVGVGGGIFLSPILILWRWAKPHEAASVAAVFIFANSLAGLAARPVDLWMAASVYWPLVILAVAGSIAGSWYGANRTSGVGMRRALGVVLSLAVFKLLSKVEL